MALAHARHRPVAGGGRVDQGLNAGVVAVAAACFVVWGLVSARLERLYVSGPIAFVVMGLVVANGPTAIVHMSLKSSTVRDLAELTLAIVLFCDAARVNVHALRRDVALPTRLLGIGLPLTVGAGAVAAFAVLPGATWWVAALIATIVAPTDAALGASIMQDVRVPAAMRRLLNVESGLNDGIVTPFVNLFLAGALSGEAVVRSNLSLAVRELGIGLAIGLGAGLVGGVLLHWSTRRHWADVAFEPLAVLGLALAAYAFAVEAGGNGFVAAFVAGMAFGSALPHDRAPSMDFAGDAGELLSLLVWLTFGALMVVPGFEHATWADVLFALLAITLIRMAPVAIALSGSGLDRVTVAFVGWFGPRGLASIVFGLLAFDVLSRPDASLVLTSVTVTITMSVLAHGASASPLARRYGAYAETLHIGRPERAAPPPFRTRSAPRTWTRR
jgi:sodium/hydrogen antiporter